MRKKVELGNLIVTYREAKNLYTARLICGPKRLEILGQFLHSLPIDGYSVWIGPACGGAVRINSLDEIEVDSAVVDYYWNADGTPR